MENNIVSELSSHPEFNTFCDLGRSIFGTKVTICNPKGSHFARRPATPFCHAVQESEEIDQRCIACDARHLQIAQRQKTPLRYHCHLGLIEMIVPVLLHDEIVAFLWCGQTFGTKPMQEDWEKVRAVLDGHGLDLKEIEKLFFKVEVVSEKRQKEMAQMAGLFASHLAYANHRIAILEQQSSSRYVMLAKSHMKTNLANSINLGDVARAVSSSVRNLTRVFLAETGITVMDYLRRLRAERASELLIDTNLTTTAIAFQTGFGTIQQFNRAFKAIHKCTPSAWRKNARQDSVE
jgi:AraC-like DNA-binding protein